MYQKDSIIVPPKSDTVRHSDITSSDPAVSDQLSQDHGSQENAPATSQKQGYNFGSIQLFDQPNSVSGLMTNAANENASALDPTLKKQMDSFFDHDFSNVRIHEGPASALAAEQLGARAYTLGNDIYLGSEGNKLEETERSRLLTHEAVHTVQQGSSTVMPHDGLKVGGSNDGAEVEARQIADSFTRSGIETTSRSLAMRDSIRNNSKGIVSNTVAPQVQRDLKVKKTVNDGDFDLDLKTESHPGAQSGMSGSIKFTANEKAPDSTKIKLLQVVRDEDLTAGSDYVWTGGEANRNKMMTSKSKDITEGYFVDHSAAAATPRSKKGDSRVSPYYRKYWPNKADSQDGSKNGKTVSEASLWDFPQSGGNRRFSFETAAKATDTGYIYATLTWGFTISDASKGKVELEYADAHRGPSKTFGAAVKAFNEFYKNPGASTAP